MMCAVVGVGDPYRPPTEMSSLISRLTLFTLAEAMDATLCGNVDDSNLYTIFLLDPSTGFPHGWTSTLWQYKCVGRTCYAFA